MVLPEKMSINAGRMKPWQIDLPALLVICLVSAGTYFALLRPVSDRCADFADKESLLVKQRRKASQLKAASLVKRENLASLQDSLADGRIKLQPTDNLNRQVAQIAGLLDGCGLETDDIQPGKKISGCGRYNIVPITLTGRGGYKNCASFFRKLSQTFPDTGASSFEISGSPGQPGADSRFRLELRWYTAAAEADRQG